MHPSNETSVHLSLDQIPIVTDLTFSILVIIIVPLSFWLTQISLHWYSQRHAQPADMGVSKSSSLTLMLVVVAVDVVCGGNVHVDTCPIGFNCLQCISGQSSEVERCMQLRLLITQTVSANLHVYVYSVQEFC